VSGSTGSTDNAILRADGTGGATLQNSAIVIDDATTSTQANVAITNQHSGQTNSALVLTPKGTGALIAGPKPDGTATGGNARGARAIDLQIVRTAANQVASSTAAIVIGEGNLASGAYSCAIGTENSSTANYTITLGVGNQASAAQSSVLGGRANAASGTGSVVCGGGNSSVGNSATGEFSITLSGRRALSDRSGMLAQANGAFSALGDAQRARFVMRNKTTTNSAVELLLEGSATRLTIPSGKVLGLTINITGISSTGAAVAHYLRQYALKNVSGTTSEVYAPVTIGTDNAAGTSIALSASDASDALVVSVTGTASTIWRWVASVDAVEIAFGT
jgi:hypothetical protein